MGAAVRGVEGAGGAGGEMSLRGGAFAAFAPLFFVYGASGQVRAVDKPLAKKICI